MDTKELDAYGHVQRIAKKTLEYMAGFIKSGMTEMDIAVECERYMRTSHMVQSFWYYNVPAIVRVGEQTTISGSGKNYVPSMEKVRQTDLVSVIVGPEMNGYWGNFARPLIVDNGSVVLTISSQPAQHLSELVQGVEVQQQLHQSLHRTASPSMTYEELYHIMNEKLRAIGYENIDFRANLGHSIEKRLADRVFIEPGSKRTLNDGLFTFETHIRNGTDGKLGFRRADVYYFSAGTLCVF